MLRPAGEIITRLEIERGLAVPAARSALVDTALAADEGDDLDALRRRLGQLWSAFSAVAAGNPDAWDRTAYGPDEIALAGPRQPDDRHAVHEAALLAVERRLGGRPRGLLGRGGPPTRRRADDGWVFPVAAAEANAMVPPHRPRDLHRSAGFAAAGGRALELAGTAGRR